VGASIISAVPVAALRDSCPELWQAPKQPTRLNAGVAKREREQLVQRAQEGDSAAFATLFRRHRSAVAAIAYRMMGPGADLEDMVQEVFLQVHRSLPDFKAQSKFSTWLHRVTVNVVLMARRRKRSRPTYTHEDHGRHESDDGLLPDQRVIRARRVEAFRRVLDRLSEKKRTVFILHELEGMAPAEIAAVVDCPVLTVRTRLFYARKELAQLMRSEPTLSGVASAGNRKSQAEGRHNDAGSVATQAEEA
jgi:RNA polymerase sigma factor (sigma-70 family)